MFHIAENHNQAYIDLRKIAFSTESGASRHVAHDQKLNHVCFTDGYYKYEVKCNEDCSLDFLNYDSGLGFSLSWNIGSIFFANAMVKDAEILRF